MKRDTIDYSFHWKSDIVLSSNSFQDFSEFSFWNSLFILLYIHICLFQFFHLSAFMKKLTHDIWKYIYHKRERNEMGLFISLVFISDPGFTAYLRYMTAALGWFMILAKLKNSSASQLFESLLGEEAQNKKNEPLIGGHSMVWNGLFGRTFFVMISVLCSKLSSIETIEGLPIPCSFF